MRKQHRFSKYPLGLILLLFVSASLYAERTHLKPGWNIFSPDQDVEMGRQVSQDAERQLPILNNRQVTSYVESLGRRLAARAPGERYPYQFRVVNDRTINAFALPGGFVYVNRGVIEASQNEGQLASVLAHEISHVALRHGTNQVSKAYVTENALGLVGGLLGNQSIGSVVAQLGIGFAADSVLLKYSRDAERQADLMGVQIMYDAGLDPNGMVGMFERLQAESKGRAATFFSSHPSPENRIVGVKSEIVKVGGPPTGRRTDSAEFQQVKSTLMGMAAPTTSNRRNTDRTGRVTGRPDNPSSRVVDLRFDDLTLRHPDNWQNYQGQDGGITLAPDGGVANGSLAYGMIVDRFDSQTYRNQRVPTIEEATNQLLDELSRSNPNMRVVRENERIRVGGLRALSTELRNESPIGGRETDWLVTVLLPNGRLYYFIGVAPQNEFRVYQDAFNRVLSSVRFRNVSSN